MNKENVPKQNARILQLMSQYLNRYSTFIKRETVENIATSCRVSTSYAYQVLLAAACGLETEEDVSDRELFNEYFPHMIQELNQDDRDAQ